MVLMAGFTPTRISYTGAEIGYTQAEISYKGDGIGYKLCGIGYKPGQSGYKWGGGWDGSPMFSSPQAVAERCKRRQQSGAVQSRDWRGV